MAAVRFLRETVENPKRDGKQALDTVLGERNSVPGVSLDYSTSNSARLAPLCAVGLLSHESAPHLLASQDSLMAQIDNKLGWSIAGLPTGPRHTRILPSRTSLLTEDQKSSIHPPRGSGTPAIWGSRVARGTHRNRPRRTLIDASSGGNFASPQTYSGGVWPHEQPPVHCACHRIRRSRHNTLPELYHALWYYRGQNIVL